MSQNCRSKVKLHAEWPMFMCHLSENECSEQVPENFRNGKSIYWQKFFVGNSFRRH